MLKTHTMSIAKSTLASLGVALFGFSLSVLPTHALTVSSQDCSAIDPTDGNVEDWEGIPDLINTTDSVEGTVYYLDSDSNEWSTTEPENWQYSANLEQQANIQQMKVCNTDTFLMMLRTEEPMMFFYDQAADSYIDFWNVYEDADGNPVNFTLPADYHYWMVWKMQAADGTGAITYMAADLTMDEGRELSGNSDEEDRVPTLYLYEESEDVDYATADFNPNTDTELTTIALSEDEGQEVDCSSGENTDPACETQEIDKEFYAFEVSQDISELFTYADFAYGHTINMSAAMYNSDEFATASGASVFSLLDETDTQEYTFSKRAMTDLHPVKKSTSSKRITLTWDKLKTANSYQIKLINPNNDKVVDVIRGIDATKYTLKGLTADTSYRAIVRGVIRKNGKKTYSAWSSGYKWTTDSE